MNSILLNIFILKKNIYNSYNEQILLYIYKKSNLNKIRKYILFYLKILKDGDNKYFNMIVKKYHNLIENDYCEGNFNTYNKIKVYLKYFKNYNFTYNLTVYHLFKKNSYKSIKILLKNFYFMFIKMG